MNKTFYTFEKSRNGETVPLINLPDGKTQVVHSLIDPKREAQRLISTITEETGFIIFLGLGGGFYPEAALELTNARVIVIDFNKNGIEELLKSKDYSKLLENSRFNLLVDPSFEEIKNFIIEQYKPALHDGIKTIPLRTRVDYDKDLFEKTAEIIQEAIEIVSGDYSAQAFFGIRWFSNIIRNVKNIDLVKNQEKNSILLSSSPEEAAIVAAGPSLDQQLPLLKKAKEKGVFIICCDTALGVLLHNGIEPDIIVSIDCQFISYYHFIGCDFNNKQRGIPLLLDIASPPLLFGLSQSPVFFSSAHPLALYISGNFKSLMRLDTSGANVTYTCLSLAKLMGINNITLYGADFSYVGSRSYARGTYINPYFSKKQNRLSPLEAQMSVFLYRSPFLLSENGKNKNYYETHSLRFYRKKLEEKASIMITMKQNTKITCAPGQGAPINIQRIINNARYTEIEKKEQIINKKYSNGRDFLEQYKKDIAIMPAVQNQSSFTEKEKLIYTTLLPLAAAIKKRNIKLKQNELMEEVKNFSISKIEKILNC
ncbi:MAG: DUF115 domain-containing protein [Treponema sp.]|nr:DUF115 domain-containing protein [Treponema sp.]